MEFSKQEKIHEIGDAIYPADMKEKINLVLTDICGRLPHGVITRNCKNKFDVPANLLPDVIGIKMLIAEYGLKPYLRPMSSMTEKEREELSDYLCEKVMSNKIGITIPPNPTQGKGIPFIWMGDCLDWLNAYHFDYHGLIEKGLALEAPEDMYKVN